MYHHGLWIQSMLRENPITKWSCIHTCIFRRLQSSNKDPAVLGHWIPVTKWMHIDHNNRATHDVSITLESFSFVEHHVRQQTLEGRWQGNVVIDNARHAYHKLLYIHCTKEGVELICLSELVMYVCMLLPHPRDIHEAHFMAGVRTSISMSTRVCVGICSIDHVQIGRKV